MTISDDNRHVIEHIFKRKVPPGTKITITVENLAAVMEATRLDERANMVGQQLDAMTEALKCGA